MDQTFSAFTEQQPPGKATSGAARRFLMATLCLIFGAPEAAARDDGASILAQEGIRQGPPGRDFWFTVPAEVPSGARSGDVYWMRSRELVPAGSEGWNMIYVTEGAGGRLVYASGEIYLGQRNAESPRRVALWNHPTAGMSDACAPSWAGDPSIVSPFGFERVPAITELLRRGYLVVMSDYQGLGTPGPAPYMDGALAAKASLDAVRAARKFARARAGESFVSYGHSQGGQTTLWAAALAASYAPELKLRGALSIAPAVDTLALIRWDVAHPPLGAYVVTTAAGLSASHPHLRLRDILTPAGLELLASMADMCFATRAAAERIEEPLVREEALKPGSPWREAIDANGDFYRFGTAAPVLVVQGARDFDVPPHVTREVVARMQGAGMEVDYRELACRDHFDVVPEASRIVPDWFDARFRTHAD